jgi:hypothetical protein
MDPEKQPFSNRNNHHFFAYCITFFCFGLVTSSIWNDIYYFSEEYMIEMKDLHYLSGTVKYLGLIAGGIFMIFCGKILPIHRLLSTAAICVGLFMTLFSKAG